MSSHSHHHANGHAANVALQPPATPAERLAQLMARHGLSPAVIAQQLGWDNDALAAYLSPENRHGTAAAQRARYTSPETDTAVEKLLVRHEIAQAARIVERTPTKVLAPMALTMRRAHAIPQLARYMTDRRSVFQPATPSSANPPASAGHSTSDTHGGAIGNRKRKRKATVKPLAEFKTASRLKPSSDLLCPVRIDVDADGVRFQDTLLVTNSSAMSPGSSPEALAARIASDERLSDIVRDAISESIKRQLLTFASFVDPSAESLHPIHLDIVIDRITLRDQFEWDIYCDLNNAESFAATLCADLSLPPAFEPAIAFSIREQVYAYRRILYSKAWIGNDPLVQKTVGHATAAQARPLGISTLEPLDDTVVREPLDTVLWQPVVSELGPDELQYLTTKIAAQRRSMVPKKPAAPQPAAAIGRPPKRATPKFRKETKVPRPINPFIMYCQVQRDLFAGPKQRRSAAESRKILGDMWRKMTDEDKEYYAQLTEVENEKRRRDHVLDLRDRGIIEWEEDEARRVGLVGSSVLDVTPEHVRGLLLANYMDERHEVDTNRPSAQDEEEGDDDDDEDDESA